jgi:hypothetical protein
MMQTIGGASMKHQKLVKNTALLDSFSDWGAMFLESPHDATEILSIKLLGGVSAASSNFMLGDMIYKQPSWWFGAPAREMNEFQKKSNFLRMGPLARTWEEKYQGDFFRPEEEGGEYARYVELLQPRLGFLDKNFFLTNGITDVPYDQDQWDIFLESVRLAGETADHVVVVMLPANPARWKLTELGQKRVAEMIATLSKTGAHLIDLASTPDITADDFQDTVHLRLDRGRTKFSTLLAEKTVPILRGESERKAP